MQQIPVPKTLDIEVVEQHLAELWKKTSGEVEDESAVLRARVANLLVYVMTDSLLKEVDALMQDVTVAHPGRALIMLGEPEAADQDIEMYVTCICQSDKRTGAKRLCGEVVVLKARGKFTVELPSATLPLLVSDLATFLWWRDAVWCSNKVFRTLVQASDRLVIDSDEFANSHPCLLETNKIFSQEPNVGISDLNWARLTLWRGLLADFYDVPAYRPLLDAVDVVRIDYVAPAGEPETLAPQALMLAGWLASRLGWSLPSEQTPGGAAEIRSIKFLSGEKRNVPSVGEGGTSREIKLNLNRVEQGERKAGRLVEVELLTSSPQRTSFSVRRSEDGRHILAEANVGADIQRGRVLPVRNRSLAQLLSREMEILTNDNLYQQALTVVTAIINLLNPNEAR